MQMDTLPGLHGVHGIAAGAVNKKIVNYRIPGGKTGVFYSC